jgi:hypothetical protein
MFKVPTWDCTEGGALIASTTILPFKDFIEEHVTSLEPMEASPAEIVRDAYQNENFGEIRNIVLDRIERLHSLFDVFEKRLDEIEEMMESVTAPGLEPARRISYAAGVGNRLDGFHAASPVFDFIGQSYTRLASIELSNTRSLDDVDTVNRWYVIHKEIVDSHRAVVSFTRKWTTYAREAVNYWGGKGSLDLGPLDPEPAMERAEELLLKLGGEPEDAAHVWFELDKVMTRCDPVLLKWPGHILWNYAMLLMKEGRAARASRFMQAAAEGFDGHEMLSSDMVAFFKDYARVLMEHDLVHTPDYLRAEVMLANAAEIGGVDDEIRSILSELLDTEVSMTAILDEVSGLKGSNSTVGWFKERAAAQRELYEGDLKRALVTVWRAVSKHWKSVPGWAASHLDWLAATLEKCVQAGDPLLAETACGIISEMAASEDLMTAVRIPYSETFAELLKEKGLSVALLVVKKKQDAEDNPDESDEPSGDAGSGDENLVVAAVGEDEKSF